MEFKKPERQTSKLSLTNKLFGSVYEVYFLGLSTVIGGHVVIWHVGLASGFYDFLIATIMIGMGYGCLTLCIAELTSVLPFSGGAYGLCRVTLGSYMGYMIGCFESLQSLFYVTSMVSVFGAMMTILFNTSMTYEPLWWLVFYAIALTIQIKGNSVLSKIVMILAVLVVLFVVVFDVGTVSTMNFSQHAIEDGNTHRTTTEEAKDFLHHLPYACWFFLGVENLPLLCGDTILAINRVPRAMLWVYYSAALSAIALLFACASHAPGVMVISKYSVLSPLTYGFSESFQLSPRLSVLLVLPGVCSAAFGFLFSLGKQSSAMANSGLFPRVLSVAYHYDAEDVEAQVPIAALIGGSLLSYCILLILWYCFDDRLMMTYLLVNVCLLASVSVYISIFASFIVFRRKYYTLDKGRPFYNPLGKYQCASVGLVVFSLAAIGLCGFQNDSYVALIVFSVYAAAMTVYYYAVCQKRQHFSAEEQAALLVAYIINTNSKGKKKITRSASFKKEHSFKNQLIKSTSFHSMHRNSLDRGRDSPSTRSLASSPGKGFGHHVASQSNSDKSVSMHVMDSRNDSLVTVRLGLNSIKETAGDIGEDRRRFIAKEVAIISESDLACRSDKNEDSKEGNKKELLNGGLACLTAESTATTSHIIFSLGIGSQDASKTTSRDCSVQNSKCSSPTHQQQKQVISQLVSTDKVRSDDTVSLEKSFSGDAGCSVRTNLMTANNSSSKVILNPHRQDSFHEGQSFSSQVFPFNNIHDSACTVDLIQPTGVRGIAMKAASSDVEDLQTSTVTAMRGCAVSDAESDEEAKRSEWMANQRPPVSKNLGSPTNGGSGKSTHSKQNSKLQLMDLSRENSSHSLRGSNKQNSIVNSSGKFIRSLFYGGTADGSLKSNNNNGSGMNIKSSFLNLRKSQQYAAPLVEEEDEETASPPTGSRKKAQRRPSLTNELYNSMQPSAQSSRFRSSKGSGGGGIAFGMRTSFSAGMGSFSILNSTDISKILPVMNCEDLLTASQTATSEYDAHTSDVVSRMIADNIGVAYFDSLLLDDLEDGPDEHEQRVEDEHQSGRVDKVKGTTARSTQIERLGSGSQMGFDLVEEINMIGESNALDRHVSSRIQSLAQGYFVQQQARQQQYAVGVSSK